MGPMEPAPAGLKGRFLHWRTLISMALALSFLVFLLFRLEVDLGETWARVRGANPFLYLLAFLTYYVSFPLRAWRWRRMLVNAGLASPHLPSSWRLTPHILINFFANCVLYARLGDAYRAYLLREDTGASLPRALGTVAAERALDLAAILFLLALSGVGLWGQESFLPLLGVGFGVVAFLFLLLGAMGRFGLALSQRLPGRLRALYLPFQEGTLGSFAQLRPVALASLGVWVLETGRVYLVVLALGVSVSPFLVLFAGQAIALLSAIPLTPAGLGLVEAGVAGVFMTALPPEEAWSVALLDRTISYLSLIPVGLALLAWRHLSRGHPDKPSPPGPLSS